MFDWIWQHVVLNALWFTLEVVPWWAWAIVIVLAAAWVWRTFGWQGLVGLALLVLTAGAYRKGWRDARSKRAPLVPVEDDVLVDFRPSIPAPKKRRKGLFERLRERN